MKYAGFVIIVLSTVPGITTAASPADISHAEKLSAAMGKLTTGDTLTLDGDIEWHGPKPLMLPAGVTLDGGGHTLTNNTKGVLLNQIGVAGVVVRNLKLTTRDHSAWTLAVKDGDLRFENCDIRCRLIAWEKGAVVLENCQVTIRFPQGNDHNGPVGVYGGGASFTATNCLFDLGWDVQHVGSGLFTNFGGQPASRLSLTGCTVIGAPDPNHRDEGRHLAVFQSENQAGPAYETTVTDSIIMAEVKAVFRSSGKGKVSSTHNNNAGMLRNPGILRGGNAAGVDFYGGQDSPVQDRTGDIEEFNPFVDAGSGDYRIIANTKTATAARDGGPLGARPVVVAREMNAYNLDFDRFVPIDHRTKGYREDLFDGWLVRREVDQQHCHATPDGLKGPALRLEILRNDEGTGGPGRTLTQNAYQSFVTIPGWTYAIGAYARRGVVPLVGKWETHGARGQAILGVADGHSPEPDKLLALTSLHGPQGAWCPGEVEVVAPSGRLTVHLIQRTDRGWSRVDFDRVSIVARAPLKTKIPEGLRGPVLGYINHVPPESEAARMARHEQVAKRRANTPILVHRGAHKFDPENTLEAYDRCMALGADGVEFDPRVTRDGVIYTFHDEKVDRMLPGGGRGDEMTYYELLQRPFKQIKGHATKQTRVPTVISLFQLARERAMLLHFDIKEAGLEDVLIGMLDEFDMWDHMVMVTPSPDSDRLRHHPKAKLLEYMPNPDFKNPEAVKRALEGPPRMIFMDADPSPAVKGLGRTGPGDQPLPDSVRAWWWPDGTSVPVDAVDSKTGG
jgi:hypothetical protein